VVILLGVGPSAALPSLGCQSFYGTQASKLGSLSQRRASGDDGWWMVDGGGWIGTVHNGSLAGPDWGRTYLIEGHARSCQDASDPAATHNWSGEGEEV
jgi:hypothetical protein